MLLQILLRLRWSCTKYGAQEDRVLTDIGGAPFRGDRITIYETERTNRSKRLCVMSMWHDVELVGVEAHLFCQQLRDKST